MTPVTCAELEELAAELALGTVSGAQRAAALDHLASCASCRDLVDQLGRVADGMLQLAPAAEPPPGFESKVLARMGVRPAPPRPVPRARRVLVGMAAMALVATLSGVTVARLGDGRGPRQEVAAGAVRTALARDDQGRWTCRAVVYGESPTWLVVSLDRTDGLTAAFSVEALPAGGADPVPVGTLAIEDGHGSLATAVGLPVDRVESVRVLDARGVLRYEMKLPST